MMKILSLFFVILITNGNNCNIYINKNIDWKKTEIDELNYEYGNAEVLYFSPNSLFKKLQYTIIRYPDKKLSIADAEGGNIYVGSWKKDKNRIYVFYKIKDYMLKLPDIIKDTVYTDTIQIIHSNSDKIYLKYKNKIFIHECEFDKRSIEFIKNID